MYFPILRGRQNELLAIRELQEVDALQNITPIIEPVKVSSTLLSVLEQFKKADKELILIANPKVGSFEKEIFQAPLMVQKIKDVLSGQDCLIKGIYCENINVIDVLNKEENCCAYFLNVSCREKYITLCDSISPKYTILPASNSRLSRIAKGEIIFIENAFQPQQRNLDYRKHEEDFLTEELFYFNQNDVKGFSDYSIVGEDYAEGGFLPKVVALHLVHLNASKNQLFIRHFTSDESEESKDIAYKYHMALEKLLEWVDQNNQLIHNTSALDEMRNIYKEGHFPGLGAAKKHAIKHHLELVNIILNESK